MSKHRFILSSLALVTCVHAAGCGAGPDAAGTGSRTHELLALEPPTAVGYAYRDPNRQGPALRLLPGQVFRGAALASLEGEISSFGIMGAMTITVCRVASPSLLDVARGGGTCGRIDTAARRPGGIFATDPGGIYSTDPGGIFASDGGGSYSLPRIGSTWDDTIDFIQVAADD